MPRAKRKVRRRAPSLVIRRTRVVTESKRLHRATDHGHAVLIDPDAFAPAQRGGGWGPFAETFLRMNAKALERLEVRAELGASDAGVRVRLLPGGRAGAIPLRSAQTGSVVGGLLVEPRFGWAGVGRVLSSTGWHAGPEFLGGPLVPGSGREVPPWVLAGPVLARLADLLRSIRRGYAHSEEILRQPRGQIVWPRYIARSLARGRWTEVPCRFPDLSFDPRLRRLLRWGLERVRAELGMVGARDVTAQSLMAVADRLLDSLRDVQPDSPRPNELRHLTQADRLLDVAFRDGLEALGWVADERGLGGGREMDGLAWSLPLPQLWESYVEAFYRRGASLTGAQVRTGRKRETVFPLEWSDPSHRSLGHLVPDVVITRGSSVHIIDAKYKAHLSELDEHGWQRFTDDKREAHRADVHQALAYASLYAADEVRTTLVYPLRRTTFEALSARGRDRSVAELLHGARRVQLELRGLPFGEHG